MKKNLAPIILFVYNRPEHTRRTIEALKANELAEESDIYIFVDGPKDNAFEDQREKIQQVRDYVHGINGFKQVYIQIAEKNIGCADSIIRGVTQVINKCGRAIIVEDDILTNKFFLRYMNEALNRYEKDRRIFSIGGYQCNMKIPWWYKKDVYIVHRHCSWGWATWKDRWDCADWEIRDYQALLRSHKLIKQFTRGGGDMLPMLIDQMEGKIDAWDIRWDYTLCKHNAYCIYPSYSLTNNCGWDGTGVHCIGGSEPIGKQYMSNRYKIHLPKRIRSSIKIQKEFCRVHETEVANFWEKVIWSVKKRVKIR